MRVILARHGNTFGPGEQPVWVGARTDLPLTAKGREQAADIGEALRTSGLVPQLVLTGPLQRTRETARLAQASAGGDADIEIDERLCEIDYGSWEGRTSEEIRRDGGTDELRAWDEEGVWPRLAGWPNSQEVYCRRLLDVLSSLRQRRKEPALIVSSNGLFRIFAASLAGNLQSKMATGHISMLRLLGDRCQIVCWNVSPSHLKETTSESPN